MDLTLISGLQNSLRTHKTLRGGYKKVDLSKEQRYINNFNKIIHRYVNQNPNHQLMFAHQKYLHLVTPADCKKWMDLYFQADPYVKYSVEEKFQHCSHVYHRSYFTACYFGHTSCSRVSVHD